MILECGFAVMGLLWLFAGTTAIAEPVVCKTGEGFINMFNGRDLTGWEGAPGWWEVRDGTIVAESTPEKPCKKSHYLYWKTARPSDFDMRAKYRISGEANSGIQFRSRRRPQWDTWGYQADLDSAGKYTGCLYQHDRGLVAQRGQSVRFNTVGTKSVDSFGNSDKLLKLVSQGQWNEYRILAKGPRIVLWINGNRMSEVEDHHKKLALRQGIIALQLHEGPPMKVEFKDLRIRIFR